MSFLKNRKPEVHEHKTKPAGQQGDGLFGKIGGVLNQTTPTIAPTVPVKQVQGLLGNLSGSLGGAKPAPQPKEEGLLGKIHGVVGGKLEPAKPTSVFGKIDQALGGGPASEANEDFLDKMIDFFQQYVLRQGPQNNETALEQLKDKAIANTIRHTFSVFRFSFPGGNIFWILILISAILSIVFAYVGLKVGFGGILRVV